MELRIFELSWSLPLFVVTMVILTIGLYMLVKHPNIRRFIPVIVLIYGLIYCWLQIYVLGKGYSGIPFILISWLLLSLLLIASLWIVISKFKKI